MSILSPAFFLADALRPSHKFFSHVMTFSWAEPVQSCQYNIKCFAQGHHTVTSVRLKPGTSWSQNEHSTTALLPKKGFQAMGVLPPDFKFNIVLMVLKHLYPVNILKYRSMFKSVAVSIYIQ